MFNHLKFGLRALLHRNQRNADIEEELQSFREAAVQEKLRRGIPPHEALRQAIAETGPTESIRHRVWQAGWESTAENLWRDLVYSLRRLARTPGLVLVVVLSIGLGIAANATIFSIVSKILLRPAPVGDPHTLTTIYIDDDNGGCCNSLSMPTYRDLRDQAKSFSGISAYVDLLPASIGNSGGSGEPERIWGQAATTNYFDVAQLSLTLGRGFSPSEDTSPVIVLSYSLWQRRFAADPSVLGKTVQLSGHPYTVIGVAPRGYRGIDLLLDPQFWVPLGNLSKLATNPPNPARRDWHYLRSAARLLPGVTDAQAAAELHVLATDYAKQYPATDKGHGLRILPAGSIGPRDKRSVELFLASLSVVVLLVLSIACANVANLMLAQGAQRQREMAVRVALGATRAQLMRQLLLESLTLALAGGALGVLLSVAATSALSSFRLPVPIPMDLSVGLDGRTLLYSLALSLVAGFLCGIVPAWSASRPLMPNALKGEDAAARPGRRLKLRDLLVVAQIALSLILLCGASLFLRSLQHAAQMDPGFRSRGILILAVDPQVHGYTPARTVQFLSALRERVLELPGVLTATTTDGVPLSMGHRSDGFTVPGQPNQQEPISVELYMASPGYFETLGIPRLAGRDFTPQDVRAQDTAPASAFLPPPANSSFPTRKTAVPIAAIVNQEFVRRLFPHQNPIGQRVNGAGTPYDIIGIVKDTKSRTIGEDQRPVLYRALAQTIPADPSSDGYQLMIRYEGDPANLTSLARSTIRSLDPTLAVFNIQTIEEHLKDALFLPRLVGTLFTVFAAIGLLLATIGLYGVMSYSVSQRTKEIGIRMALGARIGAVQHLLVTEGMRLAVLSILIGLPLALAASKLATTLLYGVHPYDAITFTLVPILLAAVSLLACYLPSRRASRIDPMTSLRADG
jgi:predicted permease